MAILPIKSLKNYCGTSNTIRNEISTGTVAQIIQGHKVAIYLADIGEHSYLQNRK